MSNEILDFIDFINFHVSVECVKGKQTKSKKLIHIKLQTS